MLADKYYVMSYCPNCRRLQREVENLRREVAALREELRRGKRQAAPFARDKPKADPKPPGRKPGHPAAFRSTPPPEAITETLQVPLTQCPHCGGPVEHVQDNAPVFETDLPALKPVSRRFDTQSGWCPRCRRRVRSRHPGQTSSAAGAARSHVGPHAAALAADLKHRLGLPFRKVVDLFHSYFGIDITAGALAQASQRLARLAQPAYQHLQQQLRASKAVHADETGWRIGGSSAWLWDFATPELTLYVIRPSRAHQVVEEVLGQRFPGVLVSDGLPTYDAVYPAQRQLCLAHLLRRATDLEKVQTRGAVRFPRAVNRLLERALALKTRSPTLSAHGLAVARGRIEAALDRLLDYHRTNPENEKFAAHLFKHRDHLFTFLDEPGVAATNNLAERQLRPAVVARKLSAGNRSQRGAHTHAVLASLAATCRQQGRRFTELAARLLCQPQNAQASSIPLLA